MCESQRLMATCSHFGVLISTALRLPGCSGLIRINLIGIPLVRYSMKSNCFKRLLALRIEGVDIRLYFFQTLFLCKRKHINNASTPNMIVLVLLADNNTDFCVVTKGNIPDKLTTILDIITISMRAQIGIHAIQQIQIIDVVDVINLFAHIKVLIPCKGNVRIWVIRNQCNFLINNSLFHFL